MNVRDFTIEVAHRIGMDKSIAYSSGSRIVGGIAGVLSVFFISMFLTGVEQGFYFTFASILALQVFFELGLTGIMTQYVAHEASHLELLPDNHYSGEDKYKSRLASLIHFCVKWYTVLSILVFIFLIVVGFIFFSRYGDSHEGVSWRIPWCIVCFATSIKIFQSPFNSIYMGLGKVKEMSKINFWQQFLTPVVIWLGLFLGFRLYVVGVGYLVSVITWQLFVMQTGLYQIIVNLWNYEIKERVDYLKEIFPYQWKIALSWVSGYFIYQLFNPVLFATVGAEAAGQMGMTLQALSAISSISLSWLNTKIPLYSKLIALKDYIQLDAIFNKTLKQMTMVCAFILIAFFIFICLLNVTRFGFGGNALADRFLSYFPLSLLIIKIFLQQFTHSWAAYLRCHKQEPFLIISVVSGIVDAITIPLFAKYFGLNGMVLGYFLLSFIFFPWGYYIYKTKKLAWHGK